MVVVGFSFSFSFSFFSFLFFPGPALAEKRNEERWHRRYSSNPTQKTKTKKKSGNVGWGLVVCELSPRAGTPKDPTAIYFDVGITSYIHLYRYSLQTPPCYEFFFFSRLPGVQLHSPFRRQAGTRDRRTWEPPILPSGKGGRGGGKTSDIYVDMDTLTGPRATTDMGWKYCRGRRKRHRSMHGMHDKDDQGGFGPSSARLPSISDTAGIFFIVYLRECSRRVDKNK